MMPKTYNTAWVAWLQFLIVFFLFFTPGDQHDVVPVYAAQIYLLVTISLNASADMIRTAAIVLMIAAVAGVVSAYATTINLTAVADITLASIHLAVMLAVAIIMVISSMHILQHNEE